jgi:allantoin racemase
MRILVLKTYAGKSREREHCERVARPGTVVEFQNLEGEFPINHVHYRYHRAKAIDGTVEHILRAEEEGYDGVCIACGVDPGLMEARELVNIPVVGTFEAGGHVASMIGHKFSVLTTVSQIVPAMYDLAMQYGFGPKLASIRTLDIPGTKLYGNQTSEDALVERINKVSRRCVEEDGAEVILLSATLAGSIYTNATKSPVTEVGAPLVDGLVAAFKMTEMMVDLKQVAGLPAVSRVAAYRAPPEAEYRKLREFYDRPLYRGLAEQVSEPQSPGA